MLSFAAIKSSRRARKQERSRSRSNTCSAAQEGPEANAVDEDAGVPDDGAGQPSSSVSDDPSSLWIAGGATALSAHGWSRMESRNQPGKFYFWHAARNERVLESKAAAQLKVGDGQNHQQPKAMPARQRPSPSPPQQRPIRMPALPRAADFDDRLWEAARGIAPRTFKCDTTEPLGLATTGSTCRDTGAVFVENVVPDSWADRRGVVVPCQILRVNSEDVTELDEATFAKFLRSRPVTLQLGELRMRDPQTMRRSAVGERNMRERSRSRSRPKSKSRSRPRPQTIDDRAIGACPERPPNGSSTGSTGPAQKNQIGKASKSHAAITATSTGSTESSQPHSLEAAPQLLKAPLWSSAPVDDDLLLPWLQQQQPVDLFDAFVPRSPSSCSSYFGGSVSESDMRPEFSPKAVEFDFCKHGTQSRRGRFSFDASKECIGFACLQGLKRPEVLNQDSFFLWMAERKYAIYGVLDGHGVHGGAVSDFAKSIFPKLLLSRPNFESDPREALRHSFEKMQRLISIGHSQHLFDASRSGTTCSIVLHCISSRKFYVAHVGDSRVVLGQRVAAKKDGPQSQWQAVELTVDHKPSLPEERARIESNGGEVIFDGCVNHRIYPKGMTPEARRQLGYGLNMSRALGDLSACQECGLSTTPDITEHIMDSSDRFLLLCSDGVWEFITSQEAVEIAAKCPAKKADLAATKLAAEGKKRWLDKMKDKVADDITAVVVHFIG